MKDEIKETLDYLKNENDYIRIEDEKKYKLLHYEEVKPLLDYITNLQEKLKVSQTNEETYRLEMQDITKILGLDEHTTFDEVKEYATNLQEENERLKEIAHKMHLWIFLHSGDEQKVYDELGLTDEENAILGYSGQFRIGEDKDVKDKR